MDAARLSGIPLFSGLSKTELDAVARAADEVDVAAGRTIVPTGDIASEFFVIEDGTASVTVDGAEVRKLGPGEFFGEIALLETGRRTATVTAETPMRLIVIFKREFSKLEHDVPAVAEKIRRAIAERPH